MATYVIIHGAWHDGDLLGDVAAHIRAAGHEVHHPTIAGNGKDADKAVGLADAIQSIKDYITEHDLTDIILAGHSYGGFIITGVADAMMERVRRLVYWNAFVPYDGQSLIDLAPTLPPDGQAAPYGEARQIALALREKGQLPADLQSVPEMIDFVLRELEEQ